MIEHKGLAKVSEDTLLLQGVLETRKPGEFISFESLASASGVCLDTRGKSLMRSALRRARLEYTPVISKGIMLAAPSTAITLCGWKIVRVDNSVRRAERTHKNLSDKFFNQLPDGDRGRMMVLGGLFGAIRACAKQFSAVIRPQIANAQSESLELPKL